MGERTEISWTNHTFNPWWGCARVSPACDHCYAEALAKRFGHDVWGSDADRRELSENYWQQPLRWDRDAEAAGRPALVFCASMADVFEVHDALPPLRARLWELIEATPHLIWQLLTKRPQHVTTMVPRSWLTDWPTNVWVGTTAEDQPHARLRIRSLTEVPAPVRFVSCEPLLGPIDLSRWLHLEWMDALRVPGEPLSWRGEGGWGQEMFGALRGDRPLVQWVIVGGESGPGHRPMAPGWATDLRDQCRAAEIPFYFKQWGGRTPTAGGCTLDGREHHEFPPEARRG